jgi:hypothetical protein
MKKRPVVLMPLSALLIAAAFSMPVQALWVNGQAPEDALLAFSQLAPLNYAVMILLLAQAALLLRASLWALPVGAALIATTLWNNWLVWAVGINFSPAEIVLASVGLACLHLLLLTPQARRALLNPKLRWWQTPVRKRVLVRTVLRPVLGGELLSKTFDLSEGGAFVELERAIWSTHDRDTPPEKLLRPGTLCVVKLTLDQFHTLNCSAEVVRIVSSVGHYPQGVGLRFKDLTREQRSLLTHYLDAVEEPRLARA